LDGLGPVPDTCGLPRASLRSIRTLRAPFRDGCGPRAAGRFVRPRDRERRMMNLVDRAIAFARLAELMPEARARFGVRELAVFGSVARGDASEASDLDVLVDFVGNATFDGFMGLKFFLEDTLGVKVDLVTRAALKPRLRVRIEAEARRVA
jgi:predicted nucleotidyltransferase